MELFSFYQTVRKQTSWKSSILDTWLSSAKVSSVQDRLSRLLSSLESRMDSNASRVSRSRGPGGDPQRTVLALAQLPNGVQGIREWWLWTVAGNQKLSHGVVAFGLFLGGGHDIATVFRDWIITGDKLSPVWYMRSSINVIANSECSNMSWAKVAPECKLFVYPCASSPAKRWGNCVPQNQTIIKYLTELKSWWSELHTAEVVGFGRQESRMFLSIFPHFSGYIVTQDNTDHP